LAFARFAGVIRTADRFSTASRRDFAICSFTTSHLTLACVASPDSFLVFFVFIEQA
jgi:hypothetical protein